MTMDSSVLTQSLLNASDFKPTPSPLTLYHQLHKQLKKILLNSYPVHPIGTDSPIMDQAEDSTLAPSLWVKSWMTHSELNGDGYKLCDGSTGIYFYDGTRMILHPNGRDLNYIHKDFFEDYHDIDVYPPVLKKKVQLLCYVNNCLSMHIEKDGDEQVKTNEQSIPLSCYPLMMEWLGFHSGALVILSNGLVQLNYTKIKTKVILCPVKKAVSLLKDGELRTFSFAGLAKVGCTIDLLDRLKDAFELIQQVLDENQIPTDPDAIRNQFRILTMV